MDHDQHPSRACHPIASKTQTTRWLLLGTLAVVVGVALSGLFLGARFLVDVAERMPSNNELATLGDMANATVVYDAAGEPTFTLFREHRLSVPLDAVSPRLVQAVLAIEDRRFYRHAGIDPIRIGGAALANLTAGRIVQGGSTITQQLARVSLLSRARTYHRKAAEALTAVRIERGYTKDEILELYLNKVYFGAGFHGVEAAARGYLGKRALDLTLGEAALLAGLIQAPARYDPTRYEERALRRRNVVLGAMVESGFVTGDEAERARREPLPNPSPEREPIGEYFEEEVRRRLVDWLGADLVYDGGLRVWTTLDPRLQRAAEQAVRDGLARIESHPSYHGSEGGRATSLQGALIALDAATGAVRAVVGGRRFDESPFNRATQARRQPGSAFKPILYAAALEQGLTAATHLTDLDTPTMTLDGEWLPEDGDLDAPSLSVRRALRLSSNRAAVKVLQATGANIAVEYARRFALGEQPAVPALALGAGTVTLERLTSAYAAFANEGIVMRPHYIRRVEDRSGAILFDVGDTSTRASRAVRPETAFIMRSLLQDVVDRGTGSRVRSEGFLGPAGGKTGTTNDYKDAWFVGFQPAITAGVWVGFDQPDTIMPKGYASTLAAPVWAQFMKAVGAPREAGPEWAPAPENIVSVEVCMLSGELARPACRHQHPGHEPPPTGRSTYREHFVDGTQPIAYCPLHDPRRHQLLAAMMSDGGLEIQAEPQRDDVRTALTQSPRGAASLDTPPPPVQTASAAMPISTPHRTPIQRGTGEQTASDVAPVRQRSTRVAVIHDHVFGSCRGVLLLTSQGVRYETDHKDAFSVDTERLQAIDIDDRKRSIRLKPADGRTYNFELDGPTGLDEVVRWQARLGEVENPFAVAND